MKYHTLFFDLDETLYPSAVGVWELISRRIDNYMVWKLNLPLEIISDLRSRLFQEYGTTMRGLIANYDIDMEEYLEYVHDIDIKQYIKPNLGLQHILKSYSQKKIVFTNSDRNHARRVLSALGIENAFSDIIDIHTVDPFCKPMPQAFELALKKMGYKNGMGCVMIDDSHRNLQTANEFGFYPIAVGNKNSEFNYSTISRIEDLPLFIPWEGKSLG
jgi:putative hydrolase of the HAD superfamily